MIFSGPTIVITFRFINLGVIIGLILFVFKKYMLSSIKAKMYAQKALFASLQKSFHMLTRKYQLLDREINQEQQLQFELKEKIMRWRARVEEEHDQLVAQRAERNQLLAAQMKEQVKRVQEQILFKKLLPDVIEQAHKQLEQQFANEKEQEKYITSTLARMGE